MEMSNLHRPTMSKYVIHRTIYANPAVRIVFITMTNKSAMTYYVNKTAIYLYLIYYTVKIIILILGYSSRWYKTYDT